MAAASKSSSSKIAAPSGKYTEAVGRRKTAVARVRLFSGSSSAHIINGIPATDYFRLSKLLAVISSPFKIADLPGKIGLSINVKGGGLSAQAEAIRHGLSRALVKLDPNLRLRLKQGGFLKRDPRMVERKKPGRHKARRAHQWQKR